MLLSVPKPLAEVAAALAEATTVFLLGCDGCAAVGEVGGAADLRRLSRGLAERGKLVVGCCVVERLCQRDLAAARLAPHAQAIERADAVLVAACGVGVQVAAGLLPRRCHPAADTVADVRAPGHWPVEERCAQCGQCRLSATGGICPLTTCVKGLLNGPCGGYRNGRCEHEPSVRPCGWLRIYERLRALGRADLLLGQPSVRDHARGRPRPPGRRAGVRSGEVRP